ncbi:iron-containing alcohol dehydrogenase [Salmonella enterica]|nr:iron-containing alcohol dehydrogenase [Salmonella enterica]EFR9145202.1 iron-containing alcohol dehydrogenase [Salmonella enterica]EFS0548873.1 iron-containing alcohol dehydrogenase [Salmonella enterica]
MNTFSLQTRLYSGQGSLAVLKRFTNKHIWIICDGFLARSPLLDTLRNALPADNRISVFSEITPDPTIHTVVQGIAQMQALQPQVVIGFGGGSAMDAAKAIVWFSQQSGINIETCVAIPTTSGTGSEVTSACVISDPDKGIKYPLFNNALYPDMAILDPELVVSVPPQITANTGMDVLTHALEAWVSPRASDFTDALAEKAAKLVFQYLPTAVEKGDCVATRGKMHNASTLAGMAFSQAGLGLNHAIAHQLGGQFHLPHGLANALLLTTVIRFNAGDPRAAKRYARLAKACGFCPAEANDVAAINALIQQIELLKQRCALPSLAVALKEGRSDFSARIPAMVQAALADITLRTNPRPASADEIRERVRAAGVVGAGGAGFPAHVKLQAQVEIFLVNAAECEPMLKVDQQLMWQQAARLVRGVQYAMTATGAREGVIALKEKYRRAIDALTPLLPDGIRLHILPDVYPAGDEVLTIWMATGRRVAPAALPASVGVVVNNVQTVLNIARAIEQQFPVTRRTLTVNGAVARPLTVTVPIGMSLHEVLALAGGATVDDPGFINGGPMMGGLITSLDNPVTKTTGGLLVLPKSHPLIQRRMQDERTVLSVARTVCEQCRLCTDLCPRHLIGHELSPHLLVRAVNFHQAATPQLLLSALTCSECNICESVACPVGISPMRINRMLKRELRAQNQRYEGPLYPADEMAKYRLVPVKRLIAKLGLSPWYQEAPLVEEEPSVEKVTLQLRQHIGASAVPTVAVGERVTRGQCVADVPPGALGASIHASIDGVVSAISEQAITVVRG